MTHLKPTVAAFACLAAALVRGDAPHPPFQGFAARTTLAVKRHAHSIVADDVNGDGRLDLIVATAEADSIAVLLGLADGRFAPATYWPVGKAPKFAVTGDFNHDGFRDIVSADQDSNTISVLLGNGDGTFRPRSSYPVCHGAHEVAVADFNRDGNDDVVVACHGKPYFASVLLGKGDGTFGPRLDLTPGAEPAAVTVGDFNGDGIPDLAFANRKDDSVAVLLGNGDGTFKAPLTFATGRAPHAIRSGDLNGDGIPDLATVNDESNSVTVLFGRGDGTFGGRLDMPANSLPKSIAIADVNGDGRPDIIITNTTYPTCCTYEGSTVSVFLNNGDGTFAPRQDFEAGGNPFSLLVRDLDGDGRTDIATANFIDYGDVQHVYLRMLRQIGVAPRLVKLAALGLSLAVGVLVGLTRWRSSRLVALLAATVIAGLLYGAFWNVSRVRTDGESHISILAGR